MKQNLVRKSSHLSCRHRPLPGTDSSARIRQTFTFEYSRYPTAGSSGFFDLNSGRPKRDTEFISINPQRNIASDSSCNPFVQYRARVRIANTQALLGGPVRSRTGSVMADLVIRFGERIRCARIHRRARHENRSFAADRGSNLLRDVCATPRSYRRPSCINRFAERLRREAGPASNPRRSPSGTSESPRTNKLGCRVISIFIDVRMAAG